MNLPEMPELPPEQRQELRLLAQGLSAFAKLTPEQWANDSTRLRMALAYASDTLYALGAGGDHATT
jgi:hypothetical protein